MIPETPACDRAFLAMELARPRVLARITEEDDTLYRVRCESCAHFPEDDSQYPYLASAAHDAREHAIATGHAVLVEAL